MPTTQSTQSHIEVFAEISEPLYRTLQEYIKANPDQDWNRVCAAALSLFLLQNGTQTTPEASHSKRLARREYLDTLFHGSSQ